MPEAPVTRATLLVRIRDADDVDAWQQFLELYGPFVHGWFRKRGLQDADAADLVQEVLQSVAAGAGRLDYDPEKGTFRSWLFTIARRRLYDFLQRRDREPSDPGSARTIDFVGESRPEDEQLWEQEYQQRLFGMAAEKVRERVDEATWRAFARTAIAGEPARVVADELNTSIGAVYVAKSRVLARIKRQVELLQGDE